ncbi:hypothetical protein KCP73_04805 [Salmonella enterica subsp. enterica]|nr:hypothetical protein KCP73_04805 [Salmonella enterica subsp. enterica]
MSLGYADSSPLWHGTANRRGGRGQVGAVRNDQYCDQMVLTDSAEQAAQALCGIRRSSVRRGDVLTDFCSAMRCMPVERAEATTFVRDRPSGLRSGPIPGNVVMPDEGTPFRYSFSAGRTAIMR